MNHDRQLMETLVLLVLTAAALGISAISPADRATWWLEVLPVFIGYAVLIATWSRFRFTSLAYRLIFLHAMVLIIGGHYTYAQVPIGFWFQENFDLARNHYDRLGHFIQGFVPAILAREVFIRQIPLRKQGWLFVLVCCFCLAFSAFYEMLEWWTAVLAGEQADAFLATQGDVWDTQWDMFLALIGSVLAQLILSRTHDRQLESC